MEIKTTTPKVSVIMITYGHEQYIEKAISSVFAQETDFEIELIIANDRSPDNTIEVVNNTIKQAPKNITVKFTTHEKNKGSNPNFLWALQQCIGQYLAICEGDDYWTDNKKLSKQVTFLDSHPEYSMYFHVSEDPAGKIRQDIETRQYNADELLNNWYIHTASTLFVNRFTEEDYNLLASSKIYYYDIILFMIMEHKGKIWGTSEKMSFYRFVPSSITNTDRDMSYYTAILDHLKTLSTMFSGRYATFVKHQVKAQAYKNFRHYALKANPRGLQYLVTYLKY